MSNSKCRTVMAAVALMAGASMLSACGQTTGDRALSGGALGAGTGAAAGYILGAPVAGAALVGGAAGAAAGALTKEDDVDLGKPIWR